MSQNIIEVGKNIKILSISNGTPGVTAAAMPKTETFFFKPGNSPAIQREAVNTSLDFLGDNADCKFVTILVTGLFRVPNQHPRYTFTKRG